MRRWIFVFTAIILLIAMPVLAQEAPQTTPEAVPGGDEGELVETTPIPTGPVDPTLPLLIGARSDMELLATAQLGGGRPVGWNGSMDINDPQLAILIRLDLETLAGALLGASARPSGWFGAVPSTPYAIARDIRHDLELLADQVIQPNVRPPGWTGADPLLRCTRATQTLVNVLERAGVFVLQVDPNLPDFCLQAELQASRFAEINLLSSPSVGGSLLGAPSGTASVNSNFAVAFLDRGARLRVGIVPNGTPITPVGRSYSEFSNMMLIQGDNFEVFVDFQFTTVTEAEFNALPDVATLDANPNCAADWCRAG